MHEHNFTVAQMPETAIGYVDLPFFDEEGRRRYFEHKPRIDNRWVRVRLKRMGQEGGRAALLL